MNGTEIPFGFFGGLPAYGTIQDDCVFLDHPLYFHAFIPGKSKSELCLRVRGLPPGGEGGLVLIVLIRALFSVLARFCIYSARFSLRRNEQEPQEERARMGVLLGPLL